ncbi:MAG: signal transduction histidine kinase [Candidatus Promineifilaceae bacterium]|jgi:signal transduction histidine kinase
MNITMTKRTILVIDDELGPRESLRYMLKDDYDITCASGVDEGIAHLRDSIPNLIIMDITMPGKTGIEGLEEIRGLDKDVPVIMLTGYGSLETAQKALRLGATDYINKPFDLPEMRKIVKKYIDQSSYDRKRVDLLNNLKEMNNQLVEEIASKDDMAALGQSSAEFVHDLRNPLMIMSGYVDLLNKQLEKAGKSKEGEHDELSTYLNAIEQSVQRCCQLTETWTSTTNRDPLANYDVFTIGQLIGKLQAGAEPFAAVADVSLEFSVPAAAEKMRGNKSQLLRALHNVVNNAIDAVESDSGTVHITCTKDIKGWVRVSVADNGCGMSPDVLDNMFEPYYTTKGKDKGTGLGTVITRKITQEHGGRIEVSSAPGMGTTIVLILPLQKGPSILIDGDPAEVRIIPLPSGRPDQKAVPRIPNDPDHSPQAVKQHIPLPMSNSGRPFTVQL